MKAWAIKESGGGHWKVSPLWPLKFDYIVAAVGEDYSCTALGVPDKSYSWIMARTPTMNPQEYLKAEARLRELGYKMDDLKKIPQNGEKP